MSAAYTKRYPNVHRTKFFCTVSGDGGSTANRIFDAIRVCMCVRVCLSEVYVYDVYCCCCCCCLFSSCEHAHLRIVDWCVRDEWTSILNRTLNLYVFFLRSTNAFIYTWDREIIFNLFIVTNFTHMHIKNQNTKIMNIHIFTVFFFVIPILFFQKLVVWPAFFSPFWFHFVWIFIFLAPAFSFTTRMKKLTFFSFGKYQREQMRTC